MVPITPPPELVKKWANASARTHRENGTYAQHEFALATQAARWGADMELEACVEWVTNTRAYDMTPGALRAARRPKSPSLKEQALDELHISFDRGYLKEGAADIIRRALEALPDD